MNVVSSTNTQKQIGRVGQSWSESQHVCVSVCVSVCLMSPSHAIFFKAYSVATAAGEGGGGGKRGGEKRKKKKKF